GGLVLALAGLGAGLQAGFMPDSQVELVLTFIAIHMVLTVVLPVLAVLVTAGEWSNGAIQTTILQRPGRLAVLVSKIIAAAVIAVVLLGFAALAGFAATAIGGAASGAGADLTLGTTEVLGMILSLAGAFAFGVATGVLMQNTALGILISIAVPFTISVASTLAGALGSERLMNVISWVQLEAAAATFAAGDVTAAAVGSVILLVVIPLLAGSVRWQRREIA
ncbi:MAG: ABC transporter permease subunit, partial [Brachybacterium sp.]|nr:ABC transporter permease subunit [Brachybacterium sp.]